MVYSSAAPAAFFNCMTERAAGCMPVLTPSFRDCVRQGQKADSTASPANKEERHLRMSLPQGVCETLLSLLSLCFQMPEFNEGK